MHTLFAMIISAFAVTVVSAGLCGAYKKKHQQPHALIDYGMWIWGGILLWAVLGIVVTIAVCEPMLSRSAEGETLINTNGTESGFDGIYIALVDLSGLITAIIATLTGVWGYFFVNRTTGNKTPSDTEKIHLVVNKEILATLLSAPSMDPAPPTDNDSAPEAEH